MKSEPIPVNIPDAEANTPSSVAKRPGTANGTTNGHPGFGYKLRGPKGRKTKVPDPKEQQTIRWIVEGRNAGWTWERIYFNLLRRRVRTRTGREWSVSRIRRAYADFQRRGGVCPEPVPARRQRERREKLGPLGRALHLLARTFR